jgi:hypothetical protein
VHPTDTGLIQMLDGSEWKIRWTWLKMDDSWWLGIAGYPILGNTMKQFCMWKNPPTWDTNFTIGSLQSQLKPPLARNLFLAGITSDPGPFPTEKPRRGGYKGDPKKSNTKMEVATQLQWHSMAVNGIHSMWHWIETLTLWPPWPSGFHPKTAAMILNKGFRHISTWAQRHLLHGDHVINSTANAK